MKEFIKEGMYVQIYVYSFQNAHLHGLSSTYENFEIRGLQIQSITHQTISWLTKWLVKTTHLIKNPHWIASLDQWNTRQIISPAKMGKRYQRKLKASKWIKFSKNKSSCIYIYLYMVSRISNIYLCPVLCLNNYCLQMI